VARLWPDVASNAVEPGWVATKMGGPGAPDDLTLGAVTQAWLAVSEEPAALESGRYLYHQRPRETNPAVVDEQVQERLLEACAALTATALPAA
jgi:NAD(P)-dependent dehydrogenase (short-subunit alcohol dehydrogenase family)